MSVPDLPGLARALNGDPPIRWVLIGGLAVVLHGGRYTTTDADISFAMDPANLEHLVEALGRINARVVRINSPVDILLIQGARFLHLDSDVGLIDLIPRPQGVDFEDLVARASEFDVEGERVLAASLEDLKLMKSTAGRSKDVLQLAEIESIEMAEGDS